MRHLPDCFFGVLVPLGNGCAPQPNRRHSVNSDVEQVENNVVTIKVAKGIWTLRSIQPSQSKKLATCRTAAAVLGAQARRRLTAPG